MRSILSVYKRSFDFEGRSSIREVGIYFIFLLIASSALVYLDVSRGWYSSDWGAGPCLMLFLVLNCLPNLALSVRRLHDSNLGSGWFVISLVPLIGPLIVLFLLFQPGTDGNNRFGPVPLR
ncbi:DUF805 domain-containing protein [Pseudomonas sp. 3A(2025)]